MSELIVTAKTVDLAVDKACSELGLTRDDISVEILEMPTRRLFSSTPAKVKVTYGPAEEPAAKAPAAPAPAPRAEHKPADKPAAPAPRAPRPEPAARPAPAQEAQTEAEEGDLPAAEEVPAEPATGEKVDAAVAYFKAAAAGMGVTEVTVEPVRIGGAVILRVDGPDVGALIGRRGETMESLSYLVSLAANRAGGDYEKFGLDVAGYRSKREKDLTALAKRIGAKVQKTGRSHMFEPMNPYERRIIHFAISQMADLSSESTGEGADRRVVVRSTAANALPDSPRAPRAPHGDRPRRDGKGGGRPPRGGRDRGPRRDGEHRDRPRPEDRPRPPRPQPTGDAPVMPERTRTVDDNFDLPLYGKIEF